MNAAIRRRKRQFLTVVLIWGALLLVLSSLPGAKVKKVLPYEFLHPLAHLIFYGIFAWFICFWLRFQRSLGVLRFGDWTIVAASLILVAVWGGFNEWVQYLRRDRYATLEDWLWNMAGGVIGLSFFFLRSRFPAVLKRHPK